MWIERRWSNAVERLAKSFPAVLVTGPRQIGKTSLLRRLYPKAAYLTFDDPSLAAFAESEPERFLSGLVGTVILDEVQYVAGLFRHLKLNIDRDPSPGRILMTGSQTFALMEGVSESLAGRCGIVEMTSLSFAEARRSFPDLTDLEFLVRGGFPALYASEDMRASDWYTSYLATYLERDVRNLRQVGDLRDFDRFLRAAAARSGALLSYAELARDVGVAPNTAKSWISVLQTSGQIQLLEPYHRSERTRLIKSPKLYFVDVGLACYLLGIGDVQTLRRSNLAGVLWESFVIGEVVRLMRADVQRSPLWFWRTANGAEVDLLIERGGRFTAIECKLSEHPGPEALKAFRTFATEYGDAAVEAGFVVCRANHPYVLDKALGAKALGVASLIDALADEGTN